MLGNAFDVNFGLSGMGRLAKDLADTRTAEGWWKRGSYPLALPAGKVVPLELGVG